MRPAVADSRKVSSPSASIARALDDVLSRLPERVAVAHRGVDRLIIGPGGAFVLHPLDDHEHPQIAAEHAQRLADATRDRFAQHLTWVPFVDWFIVGESLQDEIAVLPSSLVATTVLEGHSIPRSVAEIIRRHISLGQLAPLWHHGLPFNGEDLADVMSQMRPLT